MRFAQFYKCSWFSNMAYVLWDENNTEDKNRIIEEASSDNAKRIPFELGTEIFINQGWAIPAEGVYQNDDAGFAANLFVNGNTNEKVLAIRGTELSFDGALDPDVETQAFLDLLKADLGQTFFNGIAFSQAVSLFNYVQRLQADTNTTVQQFVLQRESVTEGTAPPTDLPHVKVHRPPTNPNSIGQDEYFWLEAGEEVQGLGLLEEGDQVAVTGHSLGGHLSALAIRLFPQLFDQAVTFNSTGYDRIGSSQLTDEFVDLFSNYLYVPAAATFTELSSRLHTLEAEDSKPGDDKSIAAHFLGQSASPETFIRTENNSHSMDQFMDALGVLSLIESLNPQLTNAGNFALYDAISNQSGNTEERFVQALSSLFLNSDAPLETVEAGPIGHGDFALRSAIHTRIVEVQQAIREAIADNGSLQLVSLVNLSANDIRARAAADTPEGLAYRYSLQNLLPFAVLGEPSLYDQEGLAAEHFSQAYLADRAEALGIILQGNLRDRAAVRREGRRPIGTDFIEHDADGGAQPLARIAGRSQGGLKTQRVLFGSDEADTLYGGGQADRLYVGAGDDVLYGSAPGVDDGHRDRLEGGAGDDTYHAGRGDAILDTDRQGTIYLNGISLAGDYRLESEADSGVLLYRHTARTIRLTLADDRAVFTRRDGSVTVEAFTTDAQPFADGDYGISLMGPEVPDDDGLNIVDGAEGNDELAGTADDDLIRGLDGDDDLYGRQGQDILEGGTGDDYLNSSAFLDGVTLFPDDPGDWLFGGDGDDIVIGNGGDDRLFGGADVGRDFLSGRSGDDFLDGGPGDDVLSGGSGSDRLVGGEGGDILLGDFDIQTTQERDWSVTPILNERGHIVNHEFQNVLSTPGGDDDAADVIHGGAGNDYISGDRGDDLLRGDAGHDTLVGGRGDDTIHGGSGNDVLYGDSAFQIDDATGNDTIHGGDGDDETFGEGGDDRLYGDAGNDFLWGEDGNDELYGGAGQDELRGGAGVDQLFGGDDNDELLGGEGHDYLDGGAGDDVLSGGEANDFLVAGAGNDVLDGGAGNDNYFYGRGNGHDVIRDSGGHDRLHFTGGIRMDEIAFSISGDDLLLALDADNSITIENGVVDSSIDVITFADDRVLTPVTLSDPELAGYLSIADEQAMNISGSTGDDYLIAEAVNSVIDGGTGNDLYVVAGTVDTLTITDGAGTDTLLFERELDAGNISGMVDNGILEADFDGVTVRINRWLDNPLERFVFADGSELDRDGIDAFLDYSPVLNRTIDTDAPAINQPFEYHIPEDLFVEPVSNEELTYRVRITGSSGWLSYDSSSRTLSGIPGYSDIGSVAIEIIARDSSFQEGSTTHTLDVLPPVDGYAVFHPGAIDGRNGTHLAFSGYSDDPQAQLDPRFHAIGDITGDGIDDLLVETNDGRSHVVFGDPEGLGETINFLDLEGTNGFIVEHQDSGRNVRAGLNEPELGLRRGDFNGDGVADILLEVTSVPADAGYDREGYVIYSGGVTTSGALILGGGSATGVVRITAMTGDSAQSTFGAVSDYNGDGIDDIRFLDKVIYGNTDLPAQIDADNLDPEAGRELVYVSTEIGDMNGDGMADYHLPGDSVVLFGSTAGLPDVVDPSAMDGSNGFRLLSSSGSITTVAGIGDFNGDGLADLAAGVPGDDRVSILYGRDDGFSADIDLADLATADGLVVTGGLQGSLGDAITPAGDINGDGRSDVLISQSGFVSTHIDALVLYGTEESPDSLLAVGEIDSDQGFFIRSDGYSYADGSVHGLAMGDINGDGHDDIQVVGSNGERYIVYGQTDQSDSVLFGTAEDDTSTLEGKPLAVYAGDGDDVISIANLDRPINAPVIEVHGGNGSDTVIVGSSGLSLNASDPETITHLDIYGGSGDDEYVINGDNVFVTIYDDGRTAGNNVLRFGENYHLDDMQLTQNEAREFVIRFTGSQTEVRLDPGNFTPWLVDTGPRAIQTVRFSDGTSLNYEAFIARGFDYQGTVQGDFFNGTNMTDRMHGGAGNDGLSSGAGNDFLYGDNGDDWLFADVGNDYLYGGAGDDYLDGYWGDDYLEGGSGDDFVEGGIGNDVYRINRDDGDDVIHEEGGIDVLEFGPDIGPGSLFLDMDGNDLVIQLSDSDSVTINNFFRNIGSGLIEFFRFADGTLLTADELLEAQFESTTILGTGGDDTLTVSGSVSHVYTGHGNDSVVINGESMLGQKRLQVSTGEGNDIIEYRGEIAGGSGTRTPRVTLEGGPGDDRYLVSGNRGNVLIRDISRPGEGNSVAFGEGYHTNNLKLGLGSLLLNFGDDQIEVHLESFDPNDVLGGPRTAETFEFADGTTLSYEELVSQGFDIDGTDNDDMLEGTNIHDRIQGFDGADSLTGGAGDDVLDGGIGDDQYHFSAGDGQDTIVDAAGDDTVVFDVSIVSESLIAAKDGSDLRINYTEDDSLLVKDWFTAEGNRIEWFELADGTLLSGSGLAGEFANEPPVISIPLVDISTDQDAEFSYTIPADSFSDPDGDSLVYEASLADGASLPDWLIFDADSRVLSGTPGNGDVGNYAVQIIAIDTEGESVTDSFTLTVDNVNDAPEVIAALTDQVIDEDALFSFVLPADTFSDPDLVHGDEITISASLFDGNPLPAWLDFDASTGTFAGTSDNSDVGELIIQVVATDLAEESASDTFTLTINNVNDAPILVTGIKDQVIDENQLFSLTIPDATFTDEDSIHGDTLSLNAALSGGNALPEWLSFDPVTGTFTGIPSFADYGEIDIQVSAVDLGGLIASDIFSLGVNVPGATIGSEGDDMLNGSNQHDTLIGLDGNDAINGGNGNDRLAGGAGDDALEGGNGRDILYGGAGNDHLSGSNSHDELFGGAGNDLLYGGNGNDLLDGGDGNDFLYGENSKDILTGGMGDDYLDGGNGSDELFGGSGDDLLHGRNGSDLLDGGAGNDFLYGDNGNDTYIFNHGYGHDHVVDDNGNDQLFLGDINHDQLWVWQSGQDLNLGVIGTDDKVTIQDWFEHNKHQVEEIHSANEQVLHKNQVDMLVQAMATFNPEATGNLDVPVHDQEQAEAVIAAAWQ